MGWLIGLAITTLTAGSWRLDALPTWSPIVTIVLVLGLSLFARVIAKTLIIGLVVGILIGVVPIDLQDILRALGL